VRLHGAEAILVTLSLLAQPRLGELLAGVALVKHDVPDAVVRATLDAVNRPLGRLHRRPEAAPVAPEVEADAGVEADAEVAAAAAEADADAAEAGAV
jgi:hypothetical protein